MLGLVNGIPERSVRVLTLTLSTFYYKDCQRIGSNPHILSPSASLRTELDQPDKSRRYVGIADLSTETSFVISKDFHETFTCKICRDLSSTHTLFLSNNNRHAKFFVEVFPLCELLLVYDVMPVASITNSVWK